MSNYNALNEGKKDYPKKRKRFVFVIGIMMTVLVVFNIFALGFRIGRVSDHHERLDFKNLSNPMENTWDSVEDDWHDAWDGLEDQWHDTWDRLEDKWDLK